MTKEELSQKISSIINNHAGYGFKAYACLNSSKCIEFMFEDNGRNSFNDFIAEKIVQSIRESFLSDIDLKRIDDVNDNTKSLYEIIQNDSYYPFKFVDTPDNGCFSDKDKNNLTGFVFKINISNDDYIWAYQQVYPFGIPQRKKGTFLYAGKKNIYKEFDKELIKIDHRVDLLIVGNSIITSNISLLENKFGFKDFIKKKSRETIQLISEMSIIDDIEKIIEFDNNEKLTNSKKLMKIKNSPVLRMNKTVLMQKLTSLPRYKGKLKFNEDNTQIIITTKKDVNELLKILNDDYLKSELTDQNYESSNKALDIENHE